MGARRDACAFCRADVTSLVQRLDTAGRMQSVTRCCDACAETQVERLAPHGRVHRLLDQPRVIRPLPQFVQASR